MIQDKTAMQMIITCGVTVQENAPLVITSITPGLPDMRIAATNHRTDLRQHHDKTCEST
jgi:hypothetical protein